MAHSPMFVPLQFKQRLDLVSRFVELEVPAGALIVRQGEPTEGAYVVLRGEVAVQRRDEQREVELARLGPGELFGEMSLLSGEAATAQVITREATTLLWLAKPYFDRLLAAVPELRSTIEQLAAGRHRGIAMSFPPPEPDDVMEIDVDVML
jgi:CRP-like cAMP-binding protein